MIARTACLAALLAATCPPVLASTSPVVAVASDQEQLADQATSTRLGLGAEQLCAAGLTAQQSTAVLVALVDELDDGARTALSAADDALRAARRLLADLDLATEGGQGSESDLTALAAAQASVESCQASVELTLTTLFEAATSGLSESTQSGLATMRANLHEGVPVQFTVRSFDEGGEEWVKLRAALNDEAAAAKSGIAADADCLALLVDWRSNEAVASAKANLDSNLAAIQAAWDATFTD